MVPSLTSPGMSHLLSPSGGHVILIPEVLALILSYLDDRSVSRTATVSMRWAEVALETVWHDVHDIRRLLFLLAPLVAEKQSAAVAYTGYNHRFKKNSSLDWVQFDRYSRRVRRLFHDESKRKFIDDTIWSNILDTRPRDDLLPNLQSLTWHTAHAERQHWSSLFVHAKLQRLSIQIHRSPSTSAYISSLLQRARKLLELELKSESPVRDIESNVLALVCCPTLQRVVAPMYFLTSPILKRLSLIPDLRTISLSKPVEQGLGDRTDVALFPPDLKEGAFPVLERLSFSAHVLHATHFLNTTFAPKNISFLYVNFIAVDGPLVVRDFFSAIADTCKSLVELHIDFVICPGAPIIHPPPPLTDRPNIETLRPLLLCSNLSRFEFRWDYQLNLTQTDLEELASQWPNLEVFLLNCQPIPEHASPVLSLEALIPFAVHCPRLTELGLYLNAQDIPSFMYSLPTFHSLQKLSVGASCITQVEPVALFLSQLCPLGCELISGVRWPDAFGIALDNLGILDRRRIQMTEWWVRWIDVAKVLPLATKARLAEKRALRQKMEAWATRRGLKRGPICDLDVDDLHTLLVC